VTGCSAPPSTKAGAVVSRTRPLHACFFAFAAPPLARAASAFSGGGSPRDCVRLREKPFVHQRALLSLYFAHAKLTHCNRYHVPFRTVLACGEGCGASGACETNTDCAVCPGPMPPAGVTIRPRGFLNHTPWVELPGSSASPWLKGAARVSGAEGFNIAARGGRLRAAHFAQPEALHASLACPLVAQR
jgi:hypothetical protein